MGRVAILADAVADQIAAGEIVERPASVIKELVENALDAGASSIEIELEAGGKVSIAVSDDGTGMDRDDAVLAIDRHATSKITIASDLIGVATFGFRGEALPSIASISKFELETATTAQNGDGAEATRLVVDGGRLKDVQPTARQRGTTVRVKRLFFNAPARRKFLRTPATETRQAVAAVSRLALMRLDVAFKLTNDGRALIDAPRVSALADRIESLFGRSLAEGLIPVEHHAGAVSVRGFIQRPADAKPTGRKAFLYVNGRPFRDPFLVRAAEAGYRATIHPGTRPTMFLSLGVPGDAVDVNVHPSKLEVRFRDRRFVEATVEEAARHALGDMNAAAVMLPAATPPWDANSGGEHSFRAYTSQDGKATSASLFDDAYQVRAPAGTDIFSPDGKYLQIFSTYIVMQTPEGLAIVDQHSAHERVLYEQTMAQLGGKGAPSQRLLLPMTVDLEPRELEAVEQNRELLHTIGFEVDDFGGRSVVLHAVPNPHPRFDARRCFEEVVADRARGRFGGWANQLERFAATYACRAAIKAGQVLEQREVSTLLRRLFACQLPPHDVHGRPTIVQLPRDELERRFGRS